MTVCIAAMCRVGNERIIITASDRMITSGDDVEYEPPQVKIGALSSRVCILIAGSYPIHSEAIMKTTLHLKNSPVDTVEKVAAIYGSYIRKIRLRFAQQTVLAPWNLTLEEFLKKQKDMDPDLVSSLNHKLETYDIPETEAIIAGADDQAMHLYHVDSLGRVTCHNDIGFLAVGLGASHAKTVFMGAGYGNNWPYHMALLTTYAAKKRAEIAPGVGSATDMYYISSVGPEPLLQPFADELKRIYDDFDEQRKKMVNESFKNMEEFITAHYKKQEEERKKNEPQTSSEKGKA